VNVVAVLLLDRRSRVRPRTAAAFAVGLAILVASGLVIARQQKAQLLEGAGRPFSAALIAPRLDPQILNDAERGGEILELFARETKRLLETRPHPDVLLWPEMVFPYRFTKNGPTLREIESAVGDFQGEIIFGSAEWEDGRYYNSAFLASRDGLLSVYRKRKLFPFGEYTPWKPLLGSVRDYLPLKLRGEEYVEGDDVSPMRSVHARLGASICFESFLSDPIREQVLAGAEVLVNLTNDSWFDGTSLEERHFFVSGMRAMENGRPYIQSASWGVSGAVDAFGAILAQTNAKDGGSLTVAVTPFTELTLFTRLGPWRFLVLLVLNALLQTIAARSFKRQSFDALHSHLEKISNNATT
jgi:apolipoprotein N-acyltransferase